MGRSEHWRKQPRDPGGEGGGQWIKGALGELADQIEAVSKRAGGAQGFKSVERKLSGLVREQRKLVDRELEEGRAERVTTKQLVPGDEVLSLGVIKTID